MGWDEKHPWNDNDEKYNNHPSPISVSILEFFF
jgi:hypothetical protein